MAEVLYPDGYAPGKPYGRMVPIETVFARSSVKILHPEYQKRWKALMIASKGQLGIGGGGRTVEQQERIFLERHNKVGSGGCCSYKGGRYSLKTGYAHAAPPGSSFHETLVQGGAAAVDAVGNLKWAALNCQAYGLVQASWGNELWHFQFDEFPNSVSSWKRSGSPPPQNWKVPGQPPQPTPPTPKPTNWVTYGTNAKTPPGNPMLSKGIVHANVQELQAILCSMPTLPADGGKPIYNPEWVDIDKVGGGKPTDNLFGDATFPALAYWQEKNGLTADSKYGPQTAARLTQVRGK